MNTVKTSRTAPVISVILPVYNGGNYLKYSVESVLIQNYTNYEFLILEDCSTDNSWEYLKSIKNEKITLYRNDTNKGLFFNLNFLIKQSKSNLIKLWSQDDIMYTSCLSEVVTFHEKYPQVGYVYCGCDHINEKGELQIDNVQDDTPEIISTLLHTAISFFTGSLAGNIANVSINKNCLDEIGLFNESMKISADFDMWVRLAEYYSTGRIAKKLVCLRDHDGQLSRNEDLFLYHVKEDLVVYQNLLRYAPPVQKKAGLKMMRNHKLVFYYTLMIKAILKGKITLGLEYMKELSRFDNIIVLSFCFVKAKLMQPKRLQPKYIRKIN